MFAVSFIVFSIFPFFSSSLPFIFFLSVKLLIDVLSWTVYIIYCPFIGHNQGKVRFNWVFILINMFTTGAEKDEGKPIGH